MKWLVISIGIIGNKIENPKMEHVISWMSGELDSWAIQSDLINSEPPERTFSVGEAELWIWQNFIPHTAVLKT